MKNSQIRDMLKDKIKELISKEFDTDNMSAQELTELYSAFFSLSVDARVQRDYILADNYDCSGKYVKLCNPDIPKTVYMHVQDCCGIDSDLALSGPMFYYDFENEVYSFSQKDTFKIPIQYLENNIKHKVRFLQVISEEEYKSAFETALVEIRNNFKDL